MNEKRFKIVLVEPEIPQNTGNIVRLCSCTDCDLYLVGKLGFSLTDKYLKRAGLDYWGETNIKQVDSLEAVLEENPDANLFFFSTKAHKIYTEQKFAPGDILVFGSETRGLPEDLITKYIDISLRVPMKQGMRSLNLSNTVSVALYEAIRQTDYL